MTPFAPGVAILQRDQPLGQIIFTRRRMRVPQLGDHAMAVPQKIGESG